MRMAEMLGFEIRDKWNLVFPELYLIDAELPVYGDFLLDKKKPMGRIDFVAEDKFGKILIIEADINTSAIHIDHVSKAFLYKSAYEIDNNIFGSKKNRIVPCALIPLSTLTQRFKNIMANAKMEWIAISSKKDGIGLNICAEIECSISDKRYEVSFPHEIVY